MSTMKANKKIHKKIDKKIREEAKELMELCKKNKFDQVLCKARRLTVKYSDSAMAFNLLGLILTWVSDCSDQEVCNQLLQESCDTYRIAMDYAPSCVWTRLMYCSRLLKLKKFDEAWKEFICSESQIIEDPLDYTPLLPADMQAADTPQMRCCLVEKRCQSFKSKLCTHLLQSLANEGAAQRTRKVKALANTSPEVLAFHHANVVSSLLFACESAKNCIRHNERGVDYYRRFLQPILRISDKAVKDHETSLVLSLYHARILFLLGQYDTAERECIRGIKMVHPRDPIFDKIFYPGDPSFHEQFQREIEVKGETKDERVKYVKEQLEFLLGLICCRLKEHWGAIQSKHRAIILTSSVKVLLDYYRDTNPSVATSLDDALNFFEANKQWDYWVCPECGAGPLLSTHILWIHLCSKHERNMYDKMSWEQDNSYCGISLWKDKEEIFLTLGSRDAICRFHPLNVNVMSFQELQTRKSQERKSCLQEFKRELKTLRDNKINFQLIQLWHQVMESCHINYCEALLPFFRLYKRAELLIHATEVGCDQEIMLQDIESIVWAAPKDSEIQKETKDDEPATEADCDQEIMLQDIESIVWVAPKDSEIQKETKDDEHATEVGCDQVKYTLQNNFWKHWPWLEKKNRGYKWFSDVPLPYSKDYKYTWFSGVDDDSDIMSLAPAKWQLAVIDPHPKEFKVQTNDRRLVITDDKVPGSKSRMNYAWMTGKQLRSPMVGCVVTRKKSLQEVDQVFSLLMGCQHCNILKPLGVWPCKDDPSSAYIMFPHVDGAISTVPKDTLYVEDNNVIGGFTENGYTILRDILSVVQHVNIYYEHAEASRSLGDDAPLQLFPLDLSLHCIYYIRNAVGEYHVYLGNFNAESPPPELDEVNVLVRSNWNAVGTCLDMLRRGRSIDQEIAHLIDSLKGPSANYADLVWEPGLWTVSEKIMFIREVFWVLESDPTKAAELASKPCLGIESFARKVVSPDWQGKDMNNDIILIRNTVIGHQSGVYLKYTGPKEEIGIKKATILKLLQKEAPLYMLKLVEEIRTLNWSIISPYRRSSSESLKWLESNFTSLVISSSVPAASSS